MYKSVFYFGKAGSNSFFFFSFLAFTKVKVKIFAVIFRVGKTHLNVSIKYNQLNLTINVDNSTFPSKVSTCICNNLHIIYIPFKRLSVFVFITVIDRTYVCRVVNKSCISFCPIVLNVFEVKT